MRMQDIPSSEFADLIKKEIGGGGAFIPFVGAGLSLASGIPTIQQMTAHLDHCVLRTLGEPSVQRDAEGAGKHHWDPRTSKWPSVYEALDKDAKWQWISKTVADLSDPKKGCSLEGVSDGIMLQAVGALGDWSSALEFLSRARWVDDKLVLATVDDQVRDSFFAHLTKGHQPNPGHVMLAHLAEPMRIQTVLTTNFDGLLEQAFERIGMPLRPFDVHLLAPLPDASLVVTEPSIVKLHGGRYGLRANATLGEKPSEGDAERFGRLFHPNGQRDPKSLLVLGTSWDYPRVMDEIGLAREAGHIGRIFWAYYEGTDLKRIRKEFRQRRINKDVFLTKHHDAGLLLLEVYQRVCLSMPPAGADYPAFWDVPAEPYKIINKRDKDYKKVFGKNRSKLLRCIHSSVASPENGSPKILLVSGGGGASSVAAKVYDRLCDELRCCIWLGMDDYYNPNHFYSALIQAIARRTGISSRMPPNPVFPKSSDLLDTETLEDCRSELRSYVSSARSPVIVFLHGRDGFGTNAGADSHGWKPKPKAQFCSLLANLRQANVLFVLLSRHDSDRLKTLLGDSNVKPCELPGRCIPFNITSVRRKMKARLRGSSEGLSEERRFLYAAVLSRHSRYCAALCSWALMKPPKPLSAWPEERPDNDRIRSELGLGWLARLEHGAVRSKPGGLFWMHQDLKNSIRKLLEKAGDPLCQASLSCECHKGIADWYAKLFRSSNDPMAALESAYQRLECLNRAAECLEEGQAMQVKETSLIEAMGILRLARSQVLAYGYFRAFSELVDVIAGKAGTLADTEPPPLCDMAVQLQVACHELVRDFAREAGCFDEAMERNDTLVEIREKQRQKKRPMVVANITREYRKNVAVLAGKYEEVRNLTGLRSYDEAEHKLLELLDGKLGLKALRKRHKSMLTGSAYKNPQKCLDEARDLGRSWVAQPQAPSPAVIRFTLRCLRRFMFLQMLAAQAEQLDANEQVVPAEKEANRLRYSEVLYTISTEIMRRLDDERFLQTENAYIRTHYGVVLSNLGRPFEAHRRLNEAAGYLFHSVKSTDPVAWAVIDLRRAEVYLDHVKRSIHGSKVPRNGVIKELKVHKALAWLDSAHAALQRARRRLEGQRREVWWWTWMHELEMSVCLYMSQIPIDDTNACAFSRDVKDVAPHCGLCDGPYDRLELLATEDQRLIRLDVLRQARLTDMLQQFRANQRMSRANSLDKLDVLIGHAAESLRNVRERRDHIGETSKHVLDARIVAYADWVLSQTG